MPNIKSAIKRMRSDVKKNVRNQTALSEIKNLEKRLESSSSDKAKAQTVGKALISKLDRAVSRGIIPRSRADRKKSRVSLRIAKIKK